MAVKATLYKSPEHPGQWIGTDAEGALVRWPDEKAGWSRRTPYNGPRRSLVEVEPALARGTSWPWAGRARRPRDPSGKRTSASIGVKATVEERGTWLRRAAEEQKSVSGWARDTLNEEIASPRSKRKP